MKKINPVTVIILLIILVGLVVGMSAGDLWHYVFDFFKTAIVWFVDWLREVILAINESFKQGIA